MKRIEKLLSSTMSRRDSLRLSGLALGGASLRGVIRRAIPQTTDPCASTPGLYPIDWETQKYTYFETLVGENNPDYTNGPPAMEKGELRITFGGSTIPPARLTQALMSVFVQVCDSTDGQPTDQMVFDLGTGSTINYNALGISDGQLDKVFINHLHFDHMADLVNLYISGPAGDRKSPLFVWGESPSGVATPAPNRTRYNDGTIAFLRNLRELCRWNSEAFSFLPTSYTDDFYTTWPIWKNWGLPNGKEPVQVGDDPPTDGYALYGIELPWLPTGVAYHNSETGVKITHFSVVHDRKGSMGYKVEWNGLTVIYTSDTKPETNTILQASNAGKGVDVFIHEMAPAPEIWACMMTHKSEPDGSAEFQAAQDATSTIQHNSHSPQGAFGYLLSQISPRPRLTVPTHFPVSDQLLGSALQSVHNHCPDIGTDVTKLYEYGLVWSMDRMVLRVFSDRTRPIQVWRPHVLQFTLPALTHLKSTSLKVPKYHYPNGNSDPYAQLDLATVIPPGPDTYCEDGF
jgi:ribonuclease Z